MKVVDLRNLFTSSNVSLIEFDGDKIYYAEEKSEEGHNSLFLLEYNLKTRRERIVANYFLTDPAYVQHFFSFPEDLVIVMESGESTVWILRVDKNTGAEKNMARLNFIGTFAECRALDESHVLLYTSANERHRQLFHEYKRLTGLSRVAYLYDLEEGRYYYARDPRICNGNAGSLLSYDQSGERQLLVLQPHGDEEEKLKCFHNMRWLGDNINDNVWLCPLLDFIVAVKAGRNAFPLSSSSAQGPAAWCAMSGWTTAVCISARGISRPGTSACAPMTSRPGENRLPRRSAWGRTKRTPSSASTRRGRAYRIAEGDGFCEVTGVLNSKIHAKYPGDLGKFVTCVDDRFIIARYILSDGKDSFEFNSIYDVENETQKSYECRCAVKGGTVVLY